MKLLKLFTLSLSLIYVLFSFCYSYTISKLSLQSDKLNQEITLLTTNLQKKELEVARKMAYTSKAVLETNKTKVDISTNLFWYHAPRFAKLSDN